MHTMKLTFAALLTVVGISFFCNTRVCGLRYAGQLLERVGECNQPERKDAISE